MFNKLLNLVKNKTSKVEMDPVPVLEVKPKKPRTTKKTLSPKELATKNKEAWYDFKIMSDEKDPSFGYVEGDWNQYHIEKLRRAGYPGENDDEVISAWIKQICVTLAKDDAELVDALNRSRVQSQKRDDGTTEYS